MASLTVMKSNVAITCGTKAIVLQLGTGNKLGEVLSSSSSIILEPPSILGQHSAETIDECEKATIEECEKTTEPYPQQLEAPATIIFASFSSCGQWLVLCSSNKQLSLWKTCNWSFVSNRVLVRSASSVRFVPSGRSIVVADKSGDAYQYSVENPTEKGTLLLGHLSMLLDILVTPDENYVITCDRDEKVRVSKFPNAYNIHCYCLGHEQFVTHLDLLPHDMSVLLSSSGDGTIMFWDYKNGKCYHTLKCSEDWKLTNSTEQDANSSANSLKIWPVKSFTTFTLEEHMSMVCALMSGVKGCLIYSASHKPQNLVCSLIQILKLNTEPWDISLTETKHLGLWVLAHEEKEPLQVFVQKTRSAQFTLDHALLDESIKLCMSFVNERNDVYTLISPPSPMTVLFKRKFDNVQEYHERKKIRCQLPNSKSIN